MAQRSKAIVGQLVGGSHHDVAANGGQAGRQSRNDGKLVGIEEEDSTAGMVDGEAELLIGQTRICRVKNCADARNGIEKLEVAVRVPGEGTEGVARLRAHGKQRSAEDKIEIQSLMRISYAGFRLQKKIKT